MRYFKGIIVLLLLLKGPMAYAQDPHFTQFSAAPFTVNPAYTGVFNGIMRVMSNYRQQWANLADPFVTTSIASDFKVGYYDAEAGQHPLNVGVQFLQDKSMAGAFKSNYLGLSAAYHVKLDEADNQSIGLGMSINYGSRRVDFADISFDQQFTSGGFDLSLPSGEAAMQNMKPFYSVAVGALFKVNNPLSGTFFDAGFSAYHVNRPTQTVMSDPNQFLPLRFSGQLGFQQYIDNYNILSIKALYQAQAQTSYLLSGVSLARLFGDDNENMLGLGIWYRTKESFSPHVFIEYSGLQVGLSYDIAYNNLKKSLTPASSLELSLQWRLDSFYR